MAAFVSSHTARPRALKCRSSMMAARVTSGFIPYGSTESTEIIVHKIQYPQAPTVSSHTARPRALKCNAAAQGILELWGFIPYGSTESTEIILPRKTQRAFHIVSSHTARPRALKLLALPPDEQRRIVSSHTARPRALKLAQGTVLSVGFTRFIPYGSTESTEMVRDAADADAALTFHPIRLDREH